MKNIALLLVTLLIPTAIAKEQPTEPQASVIALHDEATFEYLPPVELSVAVDEIELVTCYDVDCVEQNY